MFLFEMIVILFMLVFNAIFAAYEMALASVSRIKLTFLMEENKKGARDACFMKDRMEASLAVIQLGITLVGATAAAIGGAGVGDALAPYFQLKFGWSAILSQVIALIIFIIPLTIITIVLGELVPKMFALNNKELVVLALSPFMKALSALLNPVIFLLENLVKGIMRWVIRERHEVFGEEKRARLHELKTAVSLAKASRVLGIREERMILSAAQLSTRSVREIFIPVTDIFTINIESTLTQAFLKSHLDMHTRFPVCGISDDPHTIQGYINFKDIVVALKMGSGESGIKGIIRPILRVEDVSTISEALERMIQEKTHIALVVSIDKTLGMVTLEDIVEELLGEVEDEFDRPVSRIVSYGSAWLMGGGVPMLTVALKLGLDWTGRYKDSKIPSLQEWCEANNSGRPLLGGEFIESDGISVVPRKFRRKKLVEAVVGLAK